jgi:hypothetical protein
VKTDPATTAFLYGAMQHSLTHHTVEDPERGTKVGEGAQDHQAGDNELSCLSVNTVSHADAA